MYYSTVWIKSASSAQCDLCNFQVFHVSWIKEFVPAPSKSSSGGLKGNPPSPNSQTGLKKNMRTEEIYDMDT